MRSISSIYLSLLNLPCRPVPCSDFYQTPFSTRTLIWRLCYSWKCGAYLEMRSIFQGFVAACGVLVLEVRAQTSSSATTTSCSQLTPSYPTPSVAAGWNARLMVKGLTTPRGIIFDSEGNLLVVNSGVGVVGIKGGECGEAVNVVNSTSVSVDSSDRCPLIRSSTKCCYYRLVLEYLEIDRIANHV